MGTQKEEKINEVINIVNLPPIFGESFYCFRFILSFISSIIYAWLSLNLNHQIVTRNNGF
jgi:hypothetical protein